MYNGQPSYHPIHHVKLIIGNIPLLPHPSHPFARHPCTNSFQNNLLSLFLAHGNVAPDRIDPDQTRRAGFSCSRSTVLQGHHGHVSLFHPIRRDLFSGRSVSYPRVVEVCRVKETWTDWCDDLCASRVCHCAMPCFFVCRHVAAPSSSSSSAASDKSNHLALH